MNINRRNFITTTALVLPSIVVLGAISTQPKTYRSASSIYSNEEMPELCHKNGVRYVKDDELGKKLFPNNNMEVWCYGKQPPHLSVDEYINWRISIYKKMYGSRLISESIAIEDIYKLTFDGQEVIAIYYVIGY